MRNVLIRHAVTGVALFMSAHSAGAHGIAGNRFFVGTLTFDDPSVADEATVPNFSTLNQPVEGGNATDNRFDWAFSRLLTPVLEVEVDSGWINRNWPTARSSGFATTDVGIKSEIYRNNQHGIDRGAVGHRAFGGAGCGCRRAQLDSARRVFRQGFWRSTRWVRVVTPVRHHRRIRGRITIRHDYQCAQLQHT